MMESFRNNGEEKDFLQFLKNIVCDIKLKPYICVVNDINGMGGGIIRRGELAGRR